MSTDTTPLAGSLLIAMPALADPNFWHTVVLLGVHSPGEGAFGLVINRPLDVTMDDVLGELGEKPAGRDLPPVLGGGPVEPSHGFVLFESESPPDDEGIVLAEHGLAVSGNTATLLRLVRGDISSRYHLILGYSGWAPGQLEREIEESSWLVAPLDPALIFETPFEERWVAALKSIGVDPGALVTMGSSTPS
ncbi:MAG: YqgE/AlgH family protein [Acidobacteria bacterium]|nr:YqgE/AlgH family protein [Acidobacteriota bacterium]